MRGRFLGTLVAGLLTAVPLAVASPATAADVGARWAPAAQATITPGVQMFTKGAQCTGNFVFADGHGRVYVGYAAHCAGKGEATDTNGCRTRSQPLGTRVRFAQGATAVTAGDTVGHGRLAYSSWRTMRRLGTSRARLCAANDFALVRVNRRAVDRVNPSVPVWGGPTGVHGVPDTGDQVYSYGRSSLRPTDVLSPKTGAVIGRTHAGWGFDAYTVTPGIPGDSGSGFLDADGRAVGVLSTVALAPLAGSNGVGSLARELRFAQRHSGISGLHLVRGTVPFTGLQ